MNSQVKNILSRTQYLAARKLNISSVAGATQQKPSAQIDSIIRVDHAGELGADRIYAGQMAVLGNTKMGPLIQHMWDQEKVHKATFEELIVKHRVRPTALVPIWNVAGFLLGAGTALMGEKAAMACTVAVESVIVDHYNDQLRELMAEPEKNKELMQTIQKFRDDEQEHHDCGIDHGAEQAPFYKALSEVIKFGCKTAIALSKGLLSQRNQYNIVTSRSYCTSSETSKLEVKWDIYGSVCLQRKPIIMKPLNETERKVLNVLSELEFEKSYKSDHEVKIEEDLKMVEQIKSNAKNLDLDVLLQQTAHEFEEISNKEFDAFQVAPLKTEDDIKNNVKSPNRKLSSHLFLLVNHKIGNKHYWVFPFGIRKEPETLRETAERILREMCGDNLNVLFLGNAPCGFYKWVYPKNRKTESFGGKIFFFKALYFSGPVNLQINNMINDYQWAARTDFAKLFNNRKYFKKVSRFLIDDDFDNVDNVDEENESTKARKVEKET